MNIEHLSWIIGGFFWSATALVVILLAVDLYSHYSHRARIRRRMQRIAHE